MDVSVVVAAVSVVVVVVGVWVDVCLSLVDKEGWRSPCQFFLIIRNAPKGRLVKLFLIIRNAQKGR